MPAGSWQSVAPEKAEACREGRGSTILNVGGDRSSNAVVMRCCGNKDNKLMPLTLWLDNCSAVNSPTFCNEKFL